MKKHRIIIAALCAVLLISAGAMGWFFATHVRVGSYFYAKSAQALDLRDRTLTIEDYDELSALLPACEILWNVPFQGGALSCDTEEITVTALSDNDVNLLGRFSALRQLNAAQCRDFDQVLAAKDRYPQLDVDYCVSVSDSELPRDTEAAVLSDVSGEELQKTLSLLPKLRRLKLTGILPEAALLLKMREEYPDVKLSWEISIGGKSWSDDTKAISRLSGVDENTLPGLLNYLPGIASVDLRGSNLPENTCRALADNCSNVAMIFDTNVAGVDVSTDVKQIDLTGIQFEDTAELEAILPYFPNLEKVIMYDCGLSNQTMDELNRRFPNVRIVWTVKIGRLKVHTDDTWFAPVKFGAEVNKADMEPLKYCTDMVCIDIGHMWTDSCEWAAYMPNLTYLVLGDTYIKDLTPLTGLKNLKFLEVFKTPVTDYTPLLTCTGLEDLNIGFTRGDAETIFKMQWLKNLWWCQIYGISDGEGNPAWQVIEKRMPNTKVYYLDPESSTAGGWRRLDNYYAMRDYLGMFYMDG